MGYYQGLACIANETTYARIGVTDEGKPNFWTSPTSGKYELIVGNGYQNVGPIKLTTGSGANSCVNNYISAGRGYSTGSGLNGIKLVCTEQTDAISGIGQDCTGKAYELSVAAAVGTSGEGYITFVGHKIASLNTYSELGHFNFANSTFYVNGKIGVGTTSPEYAIHAVGDVYANGGWLRSSGNTGWYSQTHGGGWYMTDSTYVRSYSSKQVLIGNTLYIGTTAGGGTGLSLYGTSAPTLYGIHMSTTANYGKFGDVQSDWATYFNMNAVGQRGWIYRAGSTNVASISANGIGAFRGITTPNRGNSEGLYSNSALEIREYNYSGSGTDSWGQAPRLSFHWSGRIAAQIGLASNGYLYTAPSTGTTFYKLVYESGTWGINITGSAGSVAWANVTGKPSTFTPSSHTHTIANVSGLQTALDNKAGGSNYIDFTVGGDANTYYPVILSNVTSYFPMQFVNISRNYSETAPDTWNNNTHRGGLTLTLFWNGSKYWDGNGSGTPCYCVHKTETYCTMVGGLGNSTAGIVVWLRGGGAVYHAHSLNGKAMTATVHLSTYTDSASRTFAPTTTPSTVSVRWPGYADGADKATKDGDGNTISTTYLKLSGGTLSGNITVQKASGSTGISVNNASVGKINLQVNNNGNKGIYDNTNGKWLIYSGSDNITRVPANQTVSIAAVRNIKIIAPGTAVTPGSTAIPTGEIWMRYE